MLVKRVLNVALKRARLVPVASRLVEINGGWRGERGNILGLHPACTRSCSANNVDSLINVIRLLHASPMKTVLPHKLKIAFRFKTSKPFKNCALTSTGNGEMANHPLANLSSRAPKIHKAPWDGGHQDCAQELDSTVSKPDVASDRKASLSIRLYRKLPPADCQLHPISAPFVHIVTVAIPKPSRRKSPTDNILHTESNSGLAAHPQGATPLPVLRPRTLSSVVPSPNV